MTLRVRVDVQERYKERVQGLREISNLLFDMGVDLSFSSTFSKEDVLFVQDKIAIEMLKSGKKFDIPVMIYERTASSVLSHTKSRRELIRNPRISHWIKEMIPRDREINNKPGLEGRYHFFLLDPESENIKNPDFISSDADLDKIHALLPMFLHDRYNDIRFQSSMNWRKRPIDVFYAGTIEYDFPILTQHRIRALELIKQNASRYVIAAGPVIPKPVYNELLRSSKVFVSPYGLGEYSFKDFEAIYAGCLLVKPDSKYVTTSSFDIYGEGRYCLQTDPSLHNLPQILAFISENPGEARAIAERAGEVLRKSFDPEVYARQMFEVFSSSARDAGSASEPAGA